MTREEIEQATEKFLAQGGQIQHLDERPYFEPTWEHILDMLEANDKVSAAPSSEHVLSPGLE